ncbi:Gfo/Idh/MocA family protein [Actinokineospora bangkokensis]|uniref:Uncharacterized protein n=1 Tax=Actinokineospora bangkokensis TaxID=1193682 RepID=A0A1Q9LIB3_9PSEU|nr:Gfo/Idh/MocA family oxidoreductase [Actinokineospora bangkokensis]OLR91766.1 hypothetical protein BJP25_24890 [Actinokineospora bangkokensis]
MPAPITHDGPVRWGVLGAGGIAGSAGADLRDTPDCTVHAVGARDQRRARATADALGAPHAYGSYRDLVSDPDVDVVYIATTHGQHHEHALLAIEAGKHVLVEKAFTLTQRQAREVIAAAGERDVFCMEALWTRLHPLVRLAGDLVAEGAIGDVVSVTADLGWPFPYDPAHRLFDLDAGGSALLDLGVYPATYPLLFLGVPEGTTATGSLSPTGSDATAALQLSYPGGRFAHVACSVEAVMPGTATVVGTRGWLRFGSPLYRPSELVVHSPAADPEPRVHTADLPGSGYGPQFTEVARCLRAGEAQSPLVPHAATLALMGLMDTARAALGTRFAADGG